MYISTASIIANSVNFSWSVHVGYS